MRLLLLITMASLSAQARGLAEPSAKAQRFLLARHGETNFNAEGRIQGTLDTSTLTERGIAQAAGLGYYIASTEAKRIKQVWVSPMRRAKQTLAAVNGVCDAARVRLPEVKVRDDLREIELHHWEGRLKTEIFTAEPEGWKQWKEDPTHYVMPGGQAPLPDLWLRAQGNWEALRSTAPSDGAVLVVAHGAVGRCMVACSLGAGIHSYKDERFHFDNCNMVEVAWEPDQPFASHWRKLYTEKAPWEALHATSR